MKRFIATISTNMKKIPRFLLLLFLMLFLILIAYLLMRNNEKVTNSDNEKVSNEFAIYLVKDTDYSKIDYNNLNEINLETEPVITGADIASYDWNTSNKELNSTPLWQPVKGKISLTFKDGVNLNERMEIQGYQGARFFLFMVMVGNDRIYLGAFFSQFSSMVPPKNVNVFSLLNLDGTEYMELLDTSNIDLVHDTRIYDSLESAKN